jgi:hypothetical protein
VSFHLYNCSFNTETNNIEIQAVLHGQDGRGIVRERYQLAVTEATTTTVIDPTLVSITQVPERPPLQMILLLDITDTVPVDAIVDAITNNLMPNLLLEDEVALVTFGEEISPRTQFMADKGRLVNDYMLDLLPLSGDNRVYDGLSESVQEFPESNGTRQLILLLTDSGRRDEPQAPVEEIISSANRENLQIYTIGYYTRDTPDVPDLIEISNQTNGHSWFYTTLPNTRETIQQAVADYLENFVETSDNEIKILINMQTVQSPNEDFITLDLQLETTDNDSVDDTITCPLERLTHQINFIDEIEDATVNGVLDIGVTIESDLADNEHVIVFLANNEIVQDNDSSVYRFDADQLQPGFYNIGAQLRDLNGNVLATTPYAVQLYAQQTINMTTVPESTVDLEGELTLILNTSDAYEMLPAQFHLAPAGEPDIRQVINPEPVPFANGVATYNISDIQELVLRLFPDKPADTIFALSADVPGTSPTDPSQAIVREAVSMSITEPTAPEPTPPSLPTIDDAMLQQIKLAVLVGGGLFLLLVNYLLFRAVIRARIRRIIAFPDAYELSTQVMRVTVRRQGIEQPHPLTKKTVTIGRGSSNDINLGDDPNISRQHAIIMWRKQGWYFTNRKPRVKSSVNSKTKKGYVWVKLEPITEIVIGNALLIFHTNTQTDLSEYIKTNL